MWTFKNLFAIGLFLFGSTFLWMTAEFAGKRPPPTGAAWTLVNVLAFVTVAGFTATAWGVHKRFSWWQPAALVSAVTGLAAVVAFVIAMRQIDVAFADLGVQINVWMHLIGSLLVIAVLRWPTLHKRVASHL